MKLKTTILYDNTDLRSLFPDARDYLFDTYGEERGWESENDIPDDLVYAEAADMDRMNWEDFYEDLEHVLSRGCYLITGTCGRWNGPSNGGKFIHSASELFDCIRHLDYIKIYDENGHLKILGYHHDGSDSYEIKRLTDKGYELAYRNYFAHDRELHEAIMNCNIYSALPYIAKRLYGG